MRRLYRFGYPLIAAMDHPLSMGRVEGIESVSDVANAIARLRTAGVPSFVLNAGALAERTRGQLDEALAGSGLVVQLFGMPLSGHTGDSRVQLASIETAVSLGADAVSAQIRPADFSDSRRVQELAYALNEANSIGLPSLLMINEERWASIDRMITVVRSCQDLGCTLLKASVRGLNDDGVDRLNTIDVPILLAGGAADGTLSSSISLASKLGLRGACIGRSLVTTPNPDQIVAELDAAFKPDAPPL